MKKLHYGALSINVLVHHTEQCSDNAGSAKAVLMLAAERSYNPEHTVRFTSSFGHDLSPSLTTLTNLLGTRVEEVRCFVDDPSTLSNALRVESLSSTRRSFGLTAMARHRHDYGSVCGY